MAGSRPSGFSIGVSRGSAVTGMSRSGGRSMLGPIAGGAGGGGGGGAGASLGGGGGTALDGSAGIGPCAAAEDDRSAPARTRASPDPRLEVILKSILIFIGNQITDVRGGRQLGSSRTDLGAAGGGLRVRAARGKNWRRSGARSTIVGPWRTKRRSPAITCCGRPRRTS